MLVPPPPFSYVTSFMNVPQNLQIFFFHRESHLYVFKILNLKVVFYFPNPFDLILFCYLCINQFQKVFLCNKLLNNDRLHLIKNHVWGVFPRTGKLPGSVFPNQRDPPGRLESFRKPILSLTQWFPPLFFKYARTCVTWDMT